jgi:ribosomal protein S18 acetylase RimI-like enzyme
MEIRLARAADLDDCIVLDCSYETEYVWQVQTHVEGERIEATFQRTRLPRPVTVNTPPEARVLRQDWERQECFLVADHGAQVLGYIDMTVSDSQQVGWISNIVVGRAFRRHGIGKTLLRSARMWAEQIDLRVIIGETQPKNYPLVHLYQQMGFRFCGYNEQHYTNEDIALLFANRMR